MVESSISGRPPKSLLLRRLTSLKICTQTNRSPAVTYTTPPRPLSNAAAAEERNAQISRERAHSRHSGRDVQIARAGILFMLFLLLLLQLAPFHPSLHVSFKEDLPRLMAVVVRSLLLALISRGMAEITGCGRQRQQPPSKTVFHELNCVRLRVLN